MKSLDQYPTPVTDGITGKCALLVLEAKGSALKPSKVLQEIIEKYARECLRFERKLALCRDALALVRRISITARDDWNEKVTKHEAIRHDLDAITKLSNEAMENTEPTP